MSSSNQSDCPAVKRPSRAECGGKAAMLYELITAGFRVPPFELAPADPNELVQTVERLGLPLAVRSSASVEDGGDSSFAGQFESHKDMHLFFLNQELTAEQQAQLFAQANDNEMFAVIDRHILCLLRIHILDSSVGKGFIDKKLKVPATARNWRFAS